MSAELLALVRPGDRVTIRVHSGLDPAGRIVWRERTGRAVIVGPDRVALNMGGRYGTPGVATAENIVRVSAAPQPKLHAKD